MVSPLLLCEHHVGVGDCGEGEGWGRGVHDAGEDQDVAEGDGKVVVAAGA